MSRARKSQRKYLVAGAGKAYVVEGRARALSDAQHFVRAGTQQVCVSLVLPHGGTKKVRCFGRKKRR